MNATVYITGNSPMAVKFLEYARTLPFAEVIEDHDAPRSTWQRAIDEGAMTVDEFFDEVRRQQREHYKKLDNA